MSSTMGAVAASALVEEEEEGGRAMPAILAAMLGPDLDMGYDPPIVLLLLLLPPPPIGVFTLHVSLRDDDPGMRFSTNTAREPHESMKSILHNVWQRYSINDY